MYISVARFITVALSVLVFLPFTSLASETIGTIDSTNKYAKVCQDVTCSTFGRINFAPTINSSTPGAVAISVSDSGITGNAWGDEIGWINMNPTNGGVSVNPNTGALSGYAYASIGSWINFNPTGGGVSLVDNGSGSNFSGWAWVSGTNGGWLRFDCGDTSTCVQTDWRLAGNRAVATTTPSGGGGGGGDTPVVEESTDTKDVPTYPQPALSGKSVESSVPTWVQPLSIGDTDKKANDSLVADSDSSDTNVDIDASGIGDPNFSYNDPRSDTEYEIIASSGKEPARNCFFCVVRRYDVQINADNTVSRTGESIIKYGFVPKKVEIGIPVPFTADTKADAVSVSLTALLGLAARRLLLRVIFKFTV